jgi:hypothetical protein
VAAEAPDGLTLRRNRDLTGLEHRPWTRRVLLGVLCLPIVLGLLNVFGQRPATTKASVQAASLTIYAPKRVRSGLIFEARFHVQAHDDLKDARLVLDSNWIEGITINTIEPSPLGAASRNGDLSYDLGHIPAGKSYILFVQQQVNPTNVGRRTQTAELWDGDTHLLTISRPLTVWP